MKWWEDETTYSQNDKKRIPSIFVFYAGKLRIVVHRHIHYPEDQWLLSCYGIFDKYKLSHKDIKDAKNEALRIVKEEMEKSISIINKYKITLLLKNKYKLKRRN